MARVNLTLTDDTYLMLKEYAKKAGKPQARMAREILSDGLARLARGKRRARLARDYAAGRSDSKALLQDMEAGQLELLDDENG